MLENDRRRFAAELERHPRQAPRADLGDIEPDRGAAGERDLIDARIANQRIAGVVAAGKDADHAFREIGGLQAFRQDERVEGHHPPEKTQTARYHEEVIECRRCQLMQKVQYGAIERERSLVFEFIHEAYAALFARPR